MSEEVLSTGSHTPDSSGSEPLLSVKDLSVTFGLRGKRAVRAVDEVSFDIRPGEHFGLVGESGSGKSVTSLAIMGLLPKRGVKVGGEVKYAGRSLLDLSKKKMSEIRGRDIAMVFQDPMTSLNRWSRSARSSARSSNATSGSGNRSRATVPATCCPGWVSRTRFAG